jgi:hypothetical protein
MLRWWDGALWTTQLQPVFRPVAQAYAIHRYPKPSY